MSIARLIWRLVVLTFALVVEGLVVTTVGLSAASRFAVDAAERLDWLPPEHAGALTYLAAAALATLWAAAHAFTPWVIAVAVTELMRWRNVLVHVGAGALVAVLASILSGAFLFLPAMQIVVALGVVGGFVHWLLAGRNAGRWSEPDEVPERPRMPGPLGAGSSASGPDAPGPGTP